MSFYRFKQKCQYPIHIYYRHFKQSLSVTDKVNKKAIIYNFHNIHLYCQTKLKRYWSHTWITKHSLCKYKYYRAVELYRPFAEPSLSLRSLSSPWWWILPASQIDLDNFTLVKAKNFRKRNKNILIENQSKKNLKNFTRLLSKTT